ncbi:MAG TPA: DMT family transporter [Micromonosporaceae bacterium]|nr:DMT family transporter [Micromonosporaceae bacterium]
MTGTQTAPRPEPSGALLVLAAALLWSTTGIAGQMLAPTPPSTVAALRLVLGAAALVLMAPLLGQRGGRWRDLSSSSRWILLLAGVCTAAFQLCFFSAVRITGASVGTLTTLAAAPVFAALIDWRVRRERPGRAWYVGTALSTAGVALVTVSGGDVSVRFAGVALATLCGLCYAGYSSTTGALARQGLSRAGVVRISLSIGAVLIAPVLVGADLRPLGNTRDLLIVGWLAVAGTALPYLAFVAGLRYAAARTAASVGLAQPVAAAVLAVLILHEPVTLSLGIAAALLAAGLIVVTSPALRRARVPAPAPAAEPAQAVGRSA